FRVVLLLSFLCATGWAQVAVPPLTAQVVDQTGTLTSEQRAELERKLREFELRKGAQIAVLMVRSTAPEPIEQYSLRVVEQWTLGRNTGRAPVCAEKSGTLRRRQCRASAATPADSRTGGRRPAARDARPVSRRCHHGRNGWRAGVAARRQAGGRALRGSDCIPVHAARRGARLRLLRRLSRRLRRRRIQQQRRLQRGRRQLRRRRRIR